jgi:hypothetical protein
VTALIEGIVQGLRYNNGTQWLWGKLTYLGRDAMPSGDVKASLDFAAEGLTNLDTVVEWSKAGAHGNPWTLSVAPAAAASIAVDMDDETIKIYFVNAVTTVADVETMIDNIGDDLDSSVANGKLAVKTAGTGANVLTTAGDTMPSIDLAGGLFIEPKITVYNPEGDVIVDAQDMSQMSPSIADGFFAWWYYAIDTTVIATWIKAVNYRAVVDYTDSVLGQPTEENFLFDVAVQPFNDPLVTSEEVDKEHPTWRAFLPDTWADNESALGAWSVPINKAHRDLVRHLRGLKDHAHMIMDAGQLRNLAMAMTESHIAWAVDRLEGWRKHFDERVTSQLTGLEPLIIDRDDDQIIDADEEEGEVIQTTLFEK